MAPIRVCSVSDVPDGVLTAFFVEGWEVMVLRDSKGVLRAFDGTCPHEDFPLVDGIFDGSTITCRGHRWIFDAHTGRGLNPPGCAVDQYRLTIEGDDVLVDLEDEDGVPVEIN